MNENNLPQITEYYKNYSPPFDIKEIISRLIKGVNPKYLIGLDCIILTNKGALNSDRKKQKIKLKQHKVTLRDSLGLYYRKQNNKKAYIELFVDNILNNFSGKVIRISFFKNVAFSKVLFHEIGHHIHFTQKPMYKDREMVADKWGIILSRRYLGKKYWYLIPVYFLIKVLVKLYKFIVKKRNKFG